ncbi:peroxisomal ABC transporter 1 [Actinidia rufa]|uniref:Peroxisomal ABC transporter 1 n=1 Tax=Actinidia rufa TaxID=165716 RepID=A0A7J0EJ09_9ERIC|nr:peroxisomal ABC transporter 1 [Actinidia rufa]
MPSLQLLQLTERGRSLLASRRKIVLLATGVIVGGGAAAYLQSRYCCKRPDSVGHYNGLSDDNEQVEKAIGSESIIKKSRQKKKGGLKSLQVLAAILLSHMGRIGARDILCLVAIAFVSEGIEGAEGDETVSEWVLKRMG